MKSLELLEELNKLLIDAEKRCKLASENVGEQDKLRGDLEHELLSDYYNMTAIQKREFTDNFFNCLVERHNCKYECRELEILKTFYQIQNIKSAFNDTIYKLRKLNQEMEQPIYYKRAKKNKGEIIIVDKQNGGEKYE